ncbi:peptidase M61 [Dokdonia pacifica]|uniref:Predicted metalloprotease, contains C-terminal PDZ domain n=1 Tax=Dokdonia pacifica TaxID=1627892 RepID=A0A239D6E6_9FLAO|nr:peptidase M61 [Dokdonia pacifica]GGG40605.1 peptidase M61 [Dokdonia pacifica]SNS27920.1 Predicted metalloprotease, contains C-terminal PDZ domain [Dokdonia pacifica]
MKKIFFYAFIGAFLISCGSTQNLNVSKNTTVQVAIDIANVVEDKVSVRIQPGTITTDQVTFYVPETVPGTYSDDDYGNYIENVEVFSKTGSQLKVEKTSSNTWQIDNAINLGYIQYQVNDTYDIEAEHDIFSPSGTNFKENEQFMLNLHGLVGYIQNQEEYTYNIDINRPTEIEPTTSLSKQNVPEYTQATFEKPQQIDSYLATRYFEVIDNPIMYNAPNKEVFDIQGITIEVSVYSPNDVVKASNLRPNIEKMMKAQKTYLGAMNTTDRYSILLYLSTVGPEDAQGFGALEHHKSTVVVLPEMLPQEAMDAAIIDVVAHEFFHIVTPLNLHSTEIHKFRYNDPKMSQHLWMYEGITEYFAQHFQVHQGLVNNAEFYNTIVTKITNSKSYNDSLSFTKMSQNILDEPYASNYGNVYEKGALIGMCLDILMRENSKGERGLLSLMKELTDRYGPNRPFEDAAIIPQITEMTYPAIGDFFEKHVIGTVPINYSAFFDKVGLEYNTELAPTGYFIDMATNTPYIDGSQADNTIFIRKGIELHSFFKDIGLQGGDILKKINGTSYDLSNIYALISQSTTWKEGENISFIVDRDGQEIILEGEITKAQINKASIIELQYFVEGPELRLRQSWLKGS